MVGEVVRSAFDSMSRGRLDDIRATMQEIGWGL